MATAHPCRSAPWGAISAQRVGHPVNVDDDISAVNQERVRTMSSSIKTLCSLVLTGAIAMSAVTTLAPSIAHAQTESRSPKEGRPPAGLPPFGLPYVSERANGEFFMGAIDLDGFELENGQISAIGSLLAVGRTPIPTAFPVEITDATCDHFTLEIGPPPVLGLLDGRVHVESREDGSELRMSDFCAIARALADDDLVEVVSQLNEEDEVALGLLGLCHWAEAVGCSLAFAVCGVECVFVGPACLSCFVELIGLTLDEAAICGRCFSPEPVTLGP
jgi:hypothetical protein